MFHWTHGPFLIGVSMFLYDIFYKKLFVKYSFLILFSYTFLDGECPITYSYKKINNWSYCGGSNIQDLADLYLLPISPFWINIYIRILSSIYFYRVFVFMYELGMFNKIWIVFDGFILIGYLYQLYVEKTEPNFYYIQILCRIRYGYLILK